MPITVKSLQEALALKIEFCMVNMGVGSCSQLISFYLLIIVVERPFDQEYCLH